MNKQQLAMAAHEALHSGENELVLPNTCWRIRVVPKSGVRCVAVYSGDRRFYFFEHDPWAGNDEISLLARMGHRVTWVHERTSKESEPVKSVVIDDSYIEDVETLLKEVAAVA